MNCKLFFSTLMLFGATQLFAQKNQKWINKEDTITIYHGGEKYEVKQFRQNFKAKKPKNVILMIGDGMGVTQIFTGLTANGGHLFLENFKHVGFSKTKSATSYITDSGAGATALATGKKSFNYAISVGVDEKGDTVALETVLEKAVKRGLSTGLVATSSITHATPAAFASHVPNRNMEEDIAEHITNSGVDVFIGGGRQFFSRRKDGRNLIKELEDKGYQILQGIDEMAKVKSGKMAGLTVMESNLPYPQREMDLPRATDITLDILKNNKKGFFLMVEGSQIDWGAHNGNTSYVAREMMDFDRAIGRALEFAANDGNTLIIVTADHETGGMSILNGDMEAGIVQGAYTTGYHTGVMVPVFAYGPGAENFTGIMENEEIGQKLISLIEK